MLYTISQTVEPVLSHHVSFAQITYRLNDKQCTVWVFDRPKLFMPQRLNNCSGMGMGRNGNWLHGNGREWECEKPFPVISSMVVVHLSVCLSVVVCN